MRDFPSQPLPVRHVKREALNGDNNAVEKPAPRDTVPLEEIRQFVADLRRRMNSLDDMLKRAQQK